jgi:DNA-binding MarR family transcriptional regulator
MGLFQRGPHSDDRRGKLVSLTPRGGDAVATAEAILYRPPAAISVLTEEELNHLID